MALRKDVLKSAGVKAAAEAAEAKARAEAIRQPFQAHLDFLDEAKDLKNNASTIIEKIRHLPDLNRSTAESRDLRTQIVIQMFNYVLLHPEFTPEEKLNVLQALIDKNYPPAGLLNENVIQNVLNRGSVFLISLSAFFEFNERFQLFDTLTTSQRDSPRAIEFASYLINSIQNTDKLMTLTGNILKKFNEPNQAFLTKVIDMQLLQIELGKSESKVEVKVAGKEPSAKRIGDFLKGHREAALCCSSKTPAEKSYELIRDRNKNKKNLPKAKEQIDKAKLDLAAESKKILGR